MEAVSMEVKDDSSAALQFARSYQLEALEKAMKQNTIVYLETGSGKTLIAVMLLRSYAHTLRRPTQSNIAVFLVPAVVLVTQQAEVIEMHTDLKVGKYWGDMGVDFWDAATWQKELDVCEVLVMTPQILLDALYRTYIKMDKIKVLIFDECHNARGNHPYARIMKDFYHRQMHTNEVPRIFGMTASPIKAKVKGTSDSNAYWKDISALENLMSSKVYTCASEAVLAQYIPFPIAKAQFYKEDAPNLLQKRLVDGLDMLRKKHMSALRNLGDEGSTKQSICNKLKTLSKTFHFCLDELGFWAALKVAEIMSSEATTIFSWGELGVRGETTIKAFNSDVLKELSTHNPSGCNWSVSNVKANLDARILSSKVLCLVDSLLGYRSLEELRCIIFVERVVTAMALETILDQLLSQTSGWRAKYIAGNHPALKSQSRKEQNKIVEEFRRGAVHILVATSILEEGLDVQSCNLVIRFDPSANICSFIQSRGRARMLDSEFLLMLKEGDDMQLSRMNNYLSSGDVMRKESLNHATLPCQPVEFDEYDEIFYHVPSTGAIVTLRSSVSLIYFYCSRLPSDGYFKPSPRFTIDEESGTCKLQFPNSCPVQSVFITGDKKMLKHLACLKACKKLHEKGALTDTLVPDIVVEEGLTKDIERVPYDENHARYIPPELVSDGSRYSCGGTSHMYLMKLKHDIPVHDIPVHDICLVFKNELASDFKKMHFDMVVDWGNMSVDIEYAGKIYLTDEQVVLVRQYQVALLRVLRDRNFDKLVESLKGLYKWEKKGDVPVSLCDYLVFPCHWLHRSSLVDFKSKSSASFLRDIVQGSFSKYNRRKCVHPHPDDVYTQNGYLRRSVVENSLVCTPHNGYIYSVSGFLDGMNGNSVLRLRDGESKTYKSYYKTRHGIDLKFESQDLLCGRKIPGLRNYLLRCNQRTEKEPSGASVELPPELCHVIMSPIPAATIYTFSFLPSIMHRIESLLLSANLRGIITDRCMQNVDIPATKVLEALTTKRCQERFHLESLETLGDSFLKFAVCQQLFKLHQNNHVGLLSIKKDRIVSNAALCKLGCERKIPGFIRYDSFDPKNWNIPGDLAGDHILDNELIESTFKVYNGGFRKIKGKRVADVVEALLGAFLSSGEVPAMMFMIWLGIEVDFSCIPYQGNINPRFLVNIPPIESILKYSFNDPSLVVEALTHGSYMLPDIPRCYQRLEFLGDAVLDYLITIHLYSEYPDMSPGLLTDLRSASVNNECYALSAMRAELHKHIVHASQILHNQMTTFVASSQQLSLDSTYGWESETTFPKVLADIIESLAGAIYVDSGFNKEVVFKSIRPLLEPLITPETLKLNPVRELNNICQIHHYTMGKSRNLENGVASITLEVEADGQVHKHTCTGSEKKMAKKIASKAVLKSLKESIPNL